MFAVPRTRAPTAACVVLTAVTAPVPAAFVTYYYLDETFNGVDWDGSFQRALRQAADASSVAEVHQRTDDLLQLLGDPFTRLLRGPAASISDAERGGQVLPHPPPPASRPGPLWARSTLC